MLITSGSGRLPTQLGGHPGAAVTVAGAGPDNFRSRGAIRGPSDFWTRARHGCSPPRPARHQDPHARSARHARPLSIHSGPYDITAESTMDRRESLRPLLHPPSTPVLNRQEGVMARMVTLRGNHLPPNGMSKR